MKRTHEIVLNDFLCDAFDNDKDMLLRHDLASLVEYFSAYIDSVNTDQDFSEDTLGEKSDGVRDCFRYWLAHEDVNLSSLTFTMIATLNNLGFNAHVVRSPHIGGRPDFEHEPNPEGIVEVRFNEEPSVEKCGELNGVVNAVMSLHDWENCRRFSSVCEIDGTGRVITYKLYDHNY